MEIPFKFLYRLIEAEMTPWLSYAHLDGKSL